MTRSSLLRFLNSPKAERSEAAEAAKPPTLPHRVPGGCHSDLLEYRHMAKREPCPYGCGKSHYTEEARLKCLKAQEKSECVCDRYVRVRWLSHRPPCKVTTPRDKLEPYTAAEKAARDARNRGVTNQVRRQK